ncbi:MAG: redoxin domain-containing protein [Spirochaeta sp.]|nr:redoxin domain-containing protein [Spirochaeta sp.]
MPLRMDDLRGRFVLLDFWTYGCVNCYHMIPQLNALHERYDGRLVVVGVHSAKFSHEGESENIREAVSRYDIRYPVINDSEMILWSAYSVPGWPTIILIDPDGTIVGGTVGEWPYEPMAELLDSVIASELPEDPAPLQGLQIAAQPLLPPTLLRFPDGLLPDPERGLVYLADTGNHRVIAAEIDSGLVQQVYGSGVPGLVDASRAAGRFRSPRGLARIGSTLYIADTDNHALRAINLDTGELATLFRGAVTMPTGLRSPWGLAVHNGLLYIANAGEHQIWRYNPTDGALAPFAGSSEEGLTDGALDAAEFAQPSGLAVAGDTLYVADPESSSVRAVSLSAASADGSGPDVETAVRTLVGSGLFEFGERDGPAEDALLMHASGVAAVGDDVYIADTYNGRLKLLRDGVLSTVPLRGLLEPSAIAYDGSELWLSDRNNHRILRLRPGDETARQFELQLPGGAEQGLLLAGRVDRNEGAIRVDVELPVGYRLNAGSPNSVVARNLQGQSFSFPLEEGLEIPIESLIEARIIDPNNTRQSIELQLWLYYCREESPDICLFDGASYTVALELSTDPAEPLRLRRVVRL